jgi:hypothetical protein
VKPRNPAKLEWITLPTPQATLIRANDRVLMIMVQSSIVDPSSGELMRAVVALESPVSVFSKGPGSLQALFDHHAHEILATPSAELSEKRAKKIAAVYARRWEARQHAAKRCDCTSIETQEARPGLVKAPRRGKLTGARAPARRSRPTPLRRARA